MYTYRVGATVPYVPQMIYSLSEMPRVDVHVHLNDRNAMQNMYNNMNNNGVTLVVNDKPRAMNLLNMNVRMDVSKWMGFKKKRSILTLRAENILNEEINAPTFAYTGSPNSFPYGTGTTFYAGMTVHF